MKQATLCVPLEVKPESCSHLTTLVEQLRRREDTGEHGQIANFERITRQIPVVHFMSLSVFTARDYDPLFILEANFDGPAGVFWGQLEALFGDELRDILRCCKMPLDGDADLYEAVTAPGSVSAVAPYLEARTQAPSVFHHGNRGMTRRRILDEAALFVAIRSEIDDPGRTGADPYRGIPADAVHRTLRGSLIGIHPWLSEPAPERLPKAERIADFLRLIVFALVVLTVLALPGIVIASVVLAASVPFAGYEGSVPVVALVLCALIFLIRKPLAGTERVTKFRLLPALLPRLPLILGTIVAAGLALTAVLSLSIHILSRMIFGGPHLFGEAVGHAVRVVGYGALGLLVTVPLLILWLRFLERRDSSLDAPHSDERLLQEIVRREDWIVQNHMGSIVLIKPGILRTLVIRVGHLGLGLMLRVVATDGYLGSMRTVHFAHWAFLNNSSRLLFFSNFDHSWASYLDDFIEKAHAGLTLAWGCCTGFPATRFLIYDGASHGRQFKNWALASRAVSRFWYSAYPDLTVDQIERNNRIANGLRRSTLKPEEASQWIRDL